MAVVEMDPFVFQCICGKAQPAECAPLSPRHRPKVVKYNEHFQPNRWSWYGFIFQGMFV